MRYSMVAGLAMATTVYGHAQVYGLWQNGKDLGDGQGKIIRSPDSNSPVKDLTSPDLVCNVNGAKALTNFAKIAAGDEVAFEWYHDARNDDYIDPSHNGPIITWIAEYTEDAGTGAIWSKIDEEGYDGKTWAVENMRNNKGKKSVTIPKELKAGKYLLRQEIIALHEGDKAYSEDPVRGAQFYPSCAQIEVTGSGSAVPDQAFDFNKDYTYKDEGIVFNLYGAYSSYPIPGPKVWSAGSGASSGAKAADTEAAATTAAAAAPTTLATVAATSAAAPAETQAQQAPVASAAPTPKAGCSRRRRRALRNVNHV